MAFTFTKWYEQNKEVLSEKRKKLYREDPDYRQKVLERSAARRMSQKAPKTGVSVTDACQYLGITLWTLNRWKNEHYIPVDTLRSYRFSDHQLNLLSMLKQFFEQFPRKAAGTPANQAKLKDLVNVIHHNWEQ